MKTSLPTEIAQAGLLATCAERRDSHRHRVVSFGLVVPDEAHPGLDCTIRDISDDGARIGFASGVPLPARFWLIDVRARMVYDATVAWRDELEAGLSFRDSFTPSQIADPGLLFLRRLWLKHATR